MTKNPHVVVENRTQYQISINVWAGLVKDTIIGPFFIENRLNQQVYYDLLEEQVLPFVRELPHHVS